MQVADDAWTVGDSVQKDCGGPAQDPPNPSYSRLRSNRRRAARARRGALTPAQALQAKAAAAARHVSQMQSAARAAQRAEELARRAASDQGPILSACRCAVARQFPCEAMWPYQQWRRAFPAVGRCGRWRICSRQRSWYRFARALRARDPGQPNRTRAKPPMGGPRRARPKPSFAPSGAANEMLDDDDGTQDARRSPGSDRASMRCSGPWSALLRARGCGPKLGIAGCYVQRRSALAGWSNWGVLPRPRANDFNCAEDCWSQVPSKPASISRKAHLPWGIWRCEGV